MVDEAPDERKLLRAKRNVSERKETSVQSILRTSLYQAPLYPLAYVKVLAQVSGFELK